eukprot:364927-Chlamydomonas_euryale.AAC.21
MPALYAPPNFDPSQPLLAGLGLAKTLNPKLRPLPTASCLVGGLHTRGPASDADVLSARAIDRALRPLFPAGLRNEVHVVAQVRGKGPCTAGWNLVFNQLSLGAYCLVGVRVNGGEVQPSQPSKCSAGAGQAVLVVTAEDGRALPSFLVHEIKMYRKGCWKPSTIHANSQPTVGLITASANTSTGVELRRKRGRAATRN